MEISDKGRVKMLEKLVELKDKKISTLKQTQPKSQFSPQYEFIESGSNTIHFVFSILGKDYYVDTGFKAKENPLNRSVVVKYGERDYEYESRQVRDLLRDTLESTEKSFMKTAYLYWRQHHEIDDAYDWNDLVNERNTMHQKLFKEEEKRYKAADSWNAMIPEERIILIYRANHNKWELGENDISIFAACRDILPDKMPSQLVLDWEEERELNNYNTLKVCYIDETLKRYIKLRERTVNQEINPPYMRLRLEN